jgi:two-component system nitrogen regulation response regulator NtrX
MRSVIESKHHPSAARRSADHGSGQARSAHEPRRSSFWGERCRQGIDRARDCRASLRARERFVQVNCAAIPEELIESELFGHERGAFTGPPRSRSASSRWPIRDHFLDEIGDMSAKTQAKVLRVLQEGEVERLGSSRTIKVDVRVIAATNKDLEEEIAQGRFREDLYFRLSVIPITVPALRERLDDIAPLVQHFAALFAKENNRKAARFSPSALEAFRQARWRGNIRELRNVVDRLLIMSDREVFEADDVRQVVRTDTASSAPRVAMPSGAAGHAPRVQGVVGACVPGRKASRARWNISKTAGSHRHAAQQPLQSSSIRHQPESDG